MNREVKYGQTCGYSEGDVCCCDFSLTSIMFGLSLGLGGTLIGGEQEVPAKAAPPSQCAMYLLTVFQPRHYWDRPEGTTPQATMYL